MLIKRILTAIILIPLTLAGLFFLSPLWFCILTGLISLGAAWEWSHLMEFKSVLARVIYLIISAIILCWIVFSPISIVLVCTFVWWLFALLLIIVYPRGSERWGKSIITRGMMGLFVITPSFAAINLLRNQSEGVYAVLFLFILVFGADSVAYFVGKKWGRDKLAPLVSPGKTWQGFYGAIIFTVVLTLLTLWVSNIPFTIWPWALLLSLITVLFSIVGDLFESMMKRKANVKDSGNLLPGHGGLLDRIDSLTAAAPIFVLGGLLLGKYLS